MIKPVHTIRRALAIVCYAMTIGCGPASTESASPGGEPTLPVTEKHPTTSSSTDPMHANFYTVATYDKSLDPTDDLASTIARAESENKRVILQVGGDWCVWCSRITTYMSTNASVRSHLDKNFLVMKVTFPGDYADHFLEAYPKCVAYPHFFVLDKNGAFLHSQGTSELEKDESYDEDAFMQFLTKWTL